jgi:MFS transporter, putative metabolite:H+ symporter
MVGEESMLEYLDRQTRLTSSQYKIVTAAAIGDALEFFDYYLISYVLAFIIKPWQLTFGQSAVILLSSGIGAIAGAYIWGYIADRIGRRTVFIATVLNFSVATGILALTPEHGWIFLTVFRFFVGFGVGGLYCVDLPLVQEFMPTSKRGFIGGLVTCFIPLGTMLGAVLGAYLAPLVGWRGLFAVGLLPALLTLPVRAWVPESPRWLMRMGRFEEARKALAWALKVDPATIPLAAMAQPSGPPTRFMDLFHYPRSLFVSWVGNLGIQTGVYGLGLWSPVLLMLVMGVPPEVASFWMIFVNAGNFVGRFIFAWLSEAIGRRVSAGIVGLGAAAATVAAGLYPTAMFGGFSVFWLLLILISTIGSGGWPVIGPYAAEVWPSSLRATGMGSAYGFGGIGKVIGPAGLALIIGSSNMINPKVTLDAITPAFMYLAAWFALAGVVYLAFGFETKGRSFEAIDEQLAAERAERAVGRRPTSAPAE